MKNIYFIKYSLYKDLSFPNQVVKTLSIDEFKDYIKNKEIIILTILHEI